MTMHACVHPAWTHCLLKHVAQGSKLRKKQQVVGSSFTTHFGSTFLPVPDALSSAPLKDCAASSPNSPAVRPLVGSPLLDALLVDSSLIVDAAAAGLLQAAGTKEAA
jgi:hypothetical protein